MLRVVMVDVGVVRHDFAADERGSALLEFALCCLIVMATIFGILEFSRAIYIDHYLAGAARDAVRYAMVRGSTWSGTACATPTMFNCDAINTDVTSFVKSTVPGGMSADGLIVTTQWPGQTASGAVCDVTQGVNSPGCVVKVTVSYPFTFVGIFLANRSFQLQSAAAVTIAQ